jgi:hypothetical protein
MDDVPPVAASGPFNASPGVCGCSIFDSELSLEFEERQRALVAVLKPHIDI